MKGVQGEVHHDDDPSSNGKKRVLKRERVAKVNKEFQEISKNLMERM